MSPKRIFQSCFSSLFILLSSGNLLAGEAAQSLQLVSVERVKIPMVRQFTGTVEAVNKATMKAQTSGRLAEIVFDVDDIVKQGEVLARFSNKLQKAELDLARAGLQEAQAENERSQADFNRYQDLLEKQLVAVTVVDQARAALKASQARLDAARARIKKAQEDYEYTIIRAPYSGIVSKRHVEVGESVNPGTPLFSGISLSALRVVASVPQSLVETIRTQKQAMVYLNDGSVLKSQEITVFPFADEHSHSFTVRVELPGNLNTAGSSSLYPGMLVKTGFISGEKEVLVIPAQALVHRGEMNAVYVETASGRIVMRQVRPGSLLENNQRIIQAGLSEGEKIFLDPLAATVALKQQAAKLQ